MVDELLASELLDDPVTSRLVQQLMEMKPGDRLPSERELAEQHNISRTALRDRLGYLASIGLLERRTGSGTYVKELRPKVVSEALTLGLVSSGMTLASLTSVREALERQAAGEAARADDPVKIAYMEVAVRRMQASDDPEEMYQADITFHRALFEASKSPALLFFADVLSGVLSRSVRQRQTRIFQLTQDKGLIRQLHRAIYQAVATGNPDQAMYAMNEHFQFLEKLQAHPS